MESVYRGASDWTSTSTRARISSRCCQIHYGENGRTGLGASGAVVVLTNSLQADVIFRQRRKLQLAGGGFGKGKNAASEALVESLLHVFDDNRASS
nr:hypothetical protein FVER53263_20299 [Fusarium verticillioides]